MQPLLNDDCRNLLIDFVFYFVFKFLNPRIICAMKAKPQKTMATYPIQSSGSSIIVRMNNNAMSRAMEKLTRYVLAVCENFFIIINKPIPASMMRIDKVFSTISLLFLFCYSRKKHRPTEAGRLLIIVFSSSLRYIQPRNQHF